MKKGFLSGVLRSQHANDVQEVEPALAALAEATDGAALD